MGIRCLRCQASLVAMALGSVLQERVGALADKRLYELSSRGPFFRFLARNVKDLTCSEYFDDVPPGEFRGQIQCQDVQRLTFRSESFHICTSTEVFEHVPDDLQGFAEICRVLKPGGILLFTVPLHDMDRTRERARIENGELVHQLPPEYHGDQIRGRGKVLSFRDYGRDIVERLLAAGFGRAEIIQTIDTTGAGFRMQVVIAFKGEQG